VTMWMGHKLAVDELVIDETVLPLADLSGIQRGDALRLEWPQASAIIGNPPYHGDRLLRRELGDEYVEWLKQEFQVGVKDYCVYWFRRAQERLAADGRAGLVGTNSISQNRGRGASLEYVVSTGGVITSAISSQDWSGEAAVDVSIVNWIKQPSHPVSMRVLDGAPVPGITPSLRSTDEPDVASASRLGANAGRSFQGPIPRGAGFVLTAEEANELLAREDASYRDVVRPYLVGEDITDHPEARPQRYIIDFGQMTLQSAARYPAALDIVRERVRPNRDLDPVYADIWWMLWRPRPEMRAAVRNLDRYVAGVAQGKRIFFVWQDAWVCPSNLTNVFAFDDDYAIGILSTSIHHEWARAQSSTLEDRFRYTPTSAFETFPWPAHVDPRSVATAVGAMMTLRSKICLDRQIGLTRLYNEVDEGAYRDLRELHVALDEAVAAAYGWPASAAHDPQESNRLLLELNMAIAAGEVAYHPFD
jgi:hypothetical protein